jgi:hypothetical protein
VDTGITGIPIGADTGITGNAAEARIQEIGIANQEALVQGLRVSQTDREHFNLIFPDYLKLMTGFPTFQSEDVGAGFLH